MIVPHWLLTFVFVLHMKFVAQWEGLSDQTI